MKRDKIIYWVTTGLVATGMLLSAYQYFSGPLMAEAFKQMGYPDFLRVEIGIAKIIGSIVLILPQFPNKIKEWAYAGFGILFFSATLTHFLLNDGLERKVTAIVFLILIIISNLYFSKTHYDKNENISGKKI
ncbi:hypothetical protein ASG22_05145 [Chryseobacterium sp. Leaf405]|uniref:DoxX family protein n=1 Tax=Chryseobacterium sp. Leaf405 TaxID=1736367 RepID=UPI0006F9F4B7|nr:DoxX family protein [Chryseobacterium sp. Leaf405]KQT26065.1 hypothetical protein ASG22_05145 [Chryseobacterium sp. Leaf405]